jgi:hypothetical protein
MNTVLKIQKNRLTKTKLLHGNQYVHIGPYKLEAQWVEPVSLTCHFALRNIYTEPSISAFLNIFLFETRTMNCYFVRMLYGRFCTKFPYFVLYCKTNMAAIGSSCLLAN